MRTEGKCKCGERYIIRMHERTGNTAPITVDVYPDGNVRINDDGTYGIIPKGSEWRGDRHLNHFANCPLREQYKKKRAPKP